MKGIKEPSEAFGAETAQALKNLRKIRQEIEGLEKAIENARKMTVTDVVTGSSPHFPYGIQHFRISGKDSVKTGRLIARMEKKRTLLEEEMEKAECFLDGVADPQLRNILRLRYEVGMSWNDIAIKCDSTEDAVRMKAKRFFDLYPAIKGE